MTQDRSPRRRCLSIADFTRADVALLLRRAGFGGTTAEIDALTTKPSWAAVVDQVLDTSANPPDTIPPGIDGTGNDQYYPAWVAGVQYWMDRMATTPTPIVEKVTLFWHGLLATSVDGPVTARVFRQIQTYRRLCLGDIHTLLQAMAIDPAMLDYLDNDKNVASSPNENFARELMELFTLGNGRFSETDVVAMARAWTGHGTASGGTTYQFLANKHDNANKTLFGITRNWDGPDTITEIVRGSKQQVCARFLATRLWSFFAYPNPQPALVDSLTASLISSGMNTREFLRVLFNRPEFRSTTTRTGLVRSPIEWMVATMRSTGLPSAVAHPEWWMERIGQALYRPPNVAGWKQNGAWISSSAQWSKGSFAGYIRWKATEAGVFADVEPMTPAAAVQTAFDRFGIDEPSPISRQQLEAFVAREKAARRSWAIRSGLVTLTMLTPDFQLA